MSRVDELLRSLGQGLELTRGSTIAQRRNRTRSQRPAVYLGRAGRSHKVRLPNGEIKYVSQTHVITRGALAVGSPVTLTDGMLDAQASPYLQPHVAN